ncbi:MAG: proteasome assembly chaperone family protein [Thermoplasmata archaeon]|nr:MAG: proteasome assembly chaperone family protein [Thermoplasmata archaeon]
MSTPEINIDLKEKIELKDGILVHGFPGPGLASAIAVNYVIEQEKLPRIGTISSEVFPALTVIRDYQPGHPLRLYGKSGVIVLSSEMAPMDALARLIADNLLKFMQEQGIRRIVSLEALVSQQMQNPQAEGQAPPAPPVPPTISEGEEPEVFVVASTPELKKELEGTEVKLFKEGMITGVAGLLLSEGERLGIDVMCILTEANPMYPDARAAARLIDTLNKLKIMEIDLETLNKQAEEIEEKVRDSMMQAQKYLDAQQKQQAPDQRVVPAHMYG